MKSEQTLSLLGDTLFIRGDVNFDSTAGLIQQLDSMSLSDVQRLDCSGITHSDSAAVGLLLYLQSREIPLQGVKGPLQGLLNLYDVAGFFPDTQGE
jgi:ABC-type transporter Mla MlaB component